MFWNVLIRPWSYLTIRPWHTQKVIIDWLLPLFLSCLCVIAVFFYIGLGNVFKSGQLIDKIFGFVQTLPGFYLAALSAIATFNNPGMDQYLLGYPLKIKIIINGSKEEIRLTRRRFLTTMFAFLTAQAFFVTMLGVALTSLEPILNLRDRYLCLFLFVFLFIVWQILTITLWSLYYLGERIHIPND